MIRKHFIEAAEIVNNIIDPEERKRTAICFATLFRRFNPKFDSDKFFCACNVEII